MHAFSSDWPFICPFEIIVAAKEVCPLTMKWRIHSTGRFYDANESTVVYFDSHSGDTHLLSDFAAFIMQQFGSNSLTSEELIAQISPTIDSPSGTELILLVEGILAELASLDILKQE